MAVTKIREWLGGSGTLISDSSGEKYAASYEARIVTEIVPSGVGNPPVTRVVSASISITPDRKLALTEGPYTLHTEEHEYRRLNYESGRWRIVSSQSPLL
jgi:hypothetical protein